MLNSTTVLIAGLTAMGLGGLICAVVIAVPARRGTARRRLQAETTGETALGRTTRTTTNLISRAVGSGNRERAWSNALDRAGLRQSVPEYLVLAGSIALVLTAIGLIWQGLFLGLLLGALALAGSVGLVLARAARRRRQFADQLDDLSQLLATNLRAGHSMLQSLSALAVEIDEPARTELTRVVNQVRVGRDLGSSLEETADRMDSQDFTWVAQAIAIHRQVGGNLADVLDTVSATIRDRNELRRKVRALSAEGRSSAVILMALPVGVGLILAIVNPVYFLTFTESLLGFLMLGLIFVMMLSGGWWLWKLTQVEY